ncbi:hypothetical protein [Bacillus toyonensis]|uniref:hypothetical protein n=1 Tax=Bacillus toyonensis TaxID=155322 RepID=UPI00211EB8C3|nr:hypothetical protein [Bacillus toyonensis]
MSVPIYKLDGLSLKAKYFLYILEENGDLEGTITRLADILETSRNRVHEIIESLENAGYLEIERGSGRKPSTYRMKGILKPSGAVDQDLLNEVHSYREHFRKENERVEEELQKLKEENQRWKKLSDELKGNHSEEDNEAVMGHVAAKNVYGLIFEVDDFLKEVIIDSYLMRGSIANASDETREILNQRIEALENFVDDLKIAATGRRIDE